MSTTQADLGTQAAAPSQIKGTTKMRGIALMVLGTFMSLGMLAMLVTQASQLLNPGVIYGNESFSGTVTTGRWTVFILAYFVAFGALIAAGGWQFFRRGVLSRGMKIGLGVGFGLIALAIVYAKHSMS